ncbi:hypothetical protein ACF1A5_04110 [Streptomyces sp. NPDC014864]|uniref:hypothetical protein n=1 Tax=Streptomyces sp. NPDC014864 TaxID=3364924 RepID=UPI0036F61BF8
MPNSPSPRPAAPSTVWLARGRHAGPAAEDAVGRRLEKLKADAVLQDRLVPEDAGVSGELVFEARWQAPPRVTVRARLTLAPPAVPDGDREWVLVAEAERPWDPRWPSPAAMFWPQDDDAGWNHETVVTGLRLGTVNPLPDDDKELRRLLRHAVRDTWSIHVVVHEAMTPDERGRLPLVRLLPEGLRHRVVEHRAAPHRLRAVNWALEEFGIEVPRGGALVLPGSPAASGYDPREFSVRSVFLDGTEQAELLNAVTRFAALPRPLPDGGEAALTALREQWRLTTVEEELARARELVAMYEEALEAMTRSRDLYREAAERANEALAVYREAESEGVLSPARKQARPPLASPFQQLARGFERLKDTALSLRPAGTTPAPDTESGGAGPAGADSPGASSDVPGSPAPSAPEGSGSPEAASPAATARRAAD